MINSKESAGIQYWGVEGITQECLEAVERFLQYDDRITEVKILSDGERYCFLMTLGESDLVAIKSGFRFGYKGEGPRKFSRALALLEAHKIQMDEYAVGKDVIDRVNKSALTMGDLENIKVSRPVRPLRIYDYIEMNDHDGIRDGSLWGNFRPVVPFAIVDRRIMDLAISFWKHPDANLNDGYRRFEDILRTRIKSDEYGYDLFKKAFILENSTLVWKGIMNGERLARANLISGAYSAYRNPRAHKEKKGHSNEDLSEFLLLNHLFRLESEAIERLTTEEESGE